jgi:multidrug resistance efflux pump
MSTTLFPKEIIEFSAEQHFVENSFRSKVIYLTVLAFIIVFLVSLPLVKVDVSVQSAGIIRPGMDVNKITAPISGNILSLQISNNEPVEEGQELFTVEAPIIEEQLAFHRKRLDELAMMEADLSLIIRAVQQPSSIRSDSFQTPLYQQSFQHYRQQEQEINNRYSKVEREFERDRKLYEAKVIALAEYENKQFELEQIADQLKVMKEQQKSQWQTDLLRYQQESEELKGKISQLKKEKERYVVKAPMSGTVQNFLGIYPGSFITANQAIAEISPDTGLIVESYVSPKDIGFIYEGIPAKFQVDAFNYNQWGMVTGRIIEVSNDIQLVENQPVYRIKCALDKDFLLLKNGYEGRFKKGMTVRGRFLLAERSLFELLFDKVDDWLNPIQG